MSFWLLKSEPTTYSFSDLEREGTTVWDGITNNLAQMNMRAMKRGDFAMIYHSGKEKSIVGVSEISCDPYSASANAGGVVVEITAKSRFLRPVSLQEIRSAKELSTFDLLRLPRLSVVPVPRPIWDALIKRGEGEMRRQIK